MKIVLLIICVWISQSDIPWYQITSNCHQANNITSFNLFGGAFNNNTYEFDDNFPQLFGTDPECPDNDTQETLNVSCINSSQTPTCYFIGKFVSNGPQIYAIASDPQGIVIYNLLNALYEVSTDNPYVTYDWCCRAGCGRPSSQLGLILGICLGLVSIAIIAGIILYCCKNDNKEENTKKEDETGRMIEVG